jgi:hypothetical protein
MPERGEAPFRIERSTVGFVVAEKDRTYRRLERPYGLWYSLYSSRFLEDTSFHIPFGDGKHVETVRSLDCECERKLVALLGQDSHSSDSLDWALREFMTSCSKTVLAFGQAVFEIAREVHEKTGEIRSIWLEEVRPYMRVLNRHYQYLPPHYGGGALPGEETGAVLPARRVKLDPDRLLVVRLRSAERRAVSSTLRDLLWLSDPIDHLGLGKAATTYDYGAHRTAEHAALAKATRRVGWWPPTLDGGIALEPYFVARRLRFLEFKITLRDTILSSVNRLLKVVAPALGFECEIRLRGLLTHGDIEGARALLDKGTPRLADLVEPLF